MKAVIALIGIGIVIAMMGGIMNSVKSSTTDSRIDTFAITTANTSVGTVTLQEEPWKGLTASVLSITSNRSEDYPLAQAVAGKQLAVAGLALTGDHALTVTYDYDSMNGYAGGDSIPNLAPLLIWVGIILVIIGIGVAVFKREH